MNTLIRTIILVLISFPLAFKAPADSVATLYGTVTDAKGQPLQGAEIRIQGSDPGKIGRVHTDANGHYSYRELETGTYNVALIVNGAVKASINNVETRASQMEALNFELLRGAAAKPFAKGKHYVWMPAGQITGSHLGNWVEVNSEKPMPTGMQERLRNQGNSIVREMFDEHPSVNR
jgi:hypothetical protein